MSKTYRLKISEIVVRSLLGALISLILSVIFVFISVYFLKPDADGTLKSYSGLIDILFFVYFIFFFIIWNGFVVMKRVVIDRDFVHFKTLFSDKKIERKTVSRVNSEVYHTSRRIPVYGSGKNIFINYVNHNQSKKYSFYATCYKDCEQLVSNLQSIASK